PCAPTIFPSRIESAPWHETGLSGGLSAGADALAGQALAISAIAQPAADSAADIALIIPPLLVLGSDRISSARLFAPVQCGLGKASQLCNGSANIGEVGAGTDGHCSALRGSIGLAAGPKPS